MWFILREILKLTTHCCVIQVNKLIVSVFTNMILSEEEVYVCTLSDEVQKYCTEVLNETEDSRRKGFDEMKKWAAENPHLHINCDEKYILQFLRSCKFNLDKTKEKMKNFQKMKRDRTEWYSNRNPNLPEIQEMVRLGSFTALKQLHENRVVIIIRPMAHDPRTQSIDNMLKLSMMIMDVALRENELAQIYGVITIVDTNNMSFGHIREITISRLRYMAQSVMYYHSSPKKMEFVNAPIYISVLLKVMKTFLPKKIGDRFHANYGGVLTDVVDKSILPKDYGGEGETMEALGNYWLEKLKSYSDWFIEDEKHKAE